MAELFNFGVTRSSFLADLSVKDLDRLRMVCQKVHRDAMVARKKMYVPMSIQECDKWIESMGPKVREKRIEAAVNRGVVQ